MQFTFSLQLHAFENSDAEFHFPMSTAFLRVPKVIVILSSPDKFKQLHVIYILGLLAAYLLEH